MFRAYMYIHVTIIQMFVYTYICYIGIKWHVHVDV